MEKVSIEVRRPEEEEEEEEVGAIFEQYCVVQNWYKRFKKERMRSALRIYSSPNRLTAEEKMNSNVLPTDDDDDDLAAADVNAAFSLMSLRYTHCC